MSWALVDSWRQSAESRARGEREAAKAKFKPTPGVTHHLASCAQPYEVVMANGQLRRMWPAHIARLGAATRKRLKLHAICGLVEGCRGPERQHRVTEMRAKVTCAACLVRLDEWLERGTAELLGGRRVAFKSTPMSAG